MADIKWIKLVTDIFENRKIRQIETLPDCDAILIIWLKLLCLAGSLNDNGHLYFTDELAYTNDMLAIEFKRPVKTIDKAMNLFLSYGMIEKKDEVLRIVNWDKYQNIEGMDRIREQTRERVQRYRQSRKPETDQKTTAKADVSAECNVTERYSNVTVTQQNKNKNKNKNRLDQNENESSIPTLSPGKEKRRFVKPTIEEINDYCRQRNNGIDGAEFFDWYETKNWYVGATKMSDWKAAVRTWEHKRKTQNGSKKSELERLMDL